MTSWKMMFGSLLVLGTLSAPAMARVDVGIIVNVGPPPPPVMVAPPPPRVGYTWVPGYWYWQHGNYVWIDGSWFISRPGYRWAPERWEHRDDRYHFRPGYWEREHDNRGRAHRHESRSRGGERGRGHHDD